MKRNYFYFLLCALLLVSCTPRPVSPNIYFISEEETDIIVNCYKGNTSDKQLVTMNFTVDDKITLDQAKAQIEEKNLEILNRTIMQLKIQKGRQ